MGKYRHDIIINNHLVILGAMMGVIIMLAGCYAIPIPTAEHGILEGRVHLTEKAYQSLEPGKTTFNDVIWLLGDPDVLSRDHSKAIYIWTTIAGYVEWAVYLAQESGTEQVDKKNFLLLEFDPGGILQNIDHRAADWTLPDKYVQTIFIEDSAAVRTLRRDKYVQTVSSDWNLDESANAITWKTRTILDPVMPDSSRHKTKEKDSNVLLAMSSLNLIIIEPVSGNIWAQNIGSFKNTYNYALEDGDSARLFLKRLESDYFNRCLEAAFVRSGHSAKVVKPETHQSNEDGQFVLSIASHGIRFDCRESADEAIVQTTLDLVVKTESGDITGEGLELDYHVSGSITGDTLWNMLRYRDEGSRLLEKVMEQLIEKIQEDERWLGILPGEIE